MKKAGVITIIACVLICAAVAWSVGLYTYTHSEDTISSAGPGTGGNGSHTVNPAAADKAGSSLISGTWYGSKSLFFGMVNAEFYLTAEPDGTMTISGTANAPSFGYNNVPFSMDAEWKYLGGDSFTGSADGTEISFACDGKSISLTANPYKLGFIDNDAADMNISIQLKRI